VSTAASLRPLRRSGEHLGIILVATRATVKRVHGPGAEFEGQPIDWVTLLAMSCWYANRYIAKYGDPYG
jgi:hypothetical protein